MAKAKSERIDAGVTIRFLGRSWWIDSCKDGRRWRKNLGTANREHARTLARELAASITAGKWNAKLAAETTWERAVERYTSEYEAKHHAESTRRYTATLWRRLGVFFAVRHARPIPVSRTPVTLNVTLDQITKADVEAYQLARRDEVSVLKRRITEHTVNRDVRELKALFYWAQDNGLARVNPCVDVKPLRGDKREKRTLRPDEIGRLIEAFTSPTLQKLARFILNTGCRLGEALHAHGEDMILEGAEPHFHVRIRDEYKIKTRSERRIPLTASMLPMLAAAKLQAGADGYVFSTAGGKLIGARNAHRDIQLAARRAGLDRPQEVNWYTLRHTAITDMTRYMSLPAVKDIAGHTSITTTQKYQHPTPEDKRPRALA